jgi:LysM repeat protein
MIDEPQVTLDDTTPRKPAGLEERLRSEEPPISVDDTSPSMVMRPVQKPRANATQRLLAATMLIGALVLTIAAALIWWSGSEEDDNTANPAPTTAIGMAPTTTPTTELRATAAEPVVESNPVQTQPTILPTAAADEIAVALLTPAPIEPVAFERANQPFTITRGGGRTRVIQYTVQDGDTLDDIAQKFGLSSQWPLIWSNSRTIYSSLRPGSQLNILPEDGVYFGVSRPITIQEVADQYKVDPYTIIDSDYNPDLFGSTPQTLLVEGMWVVIPGGKGEEISLLPPTSNAAVNAQGVVTGSYTLWGCTAEVGPGSLPFTRPVDSYEFMQGFSYGGHEGVDLAGTPGAPIYAAGSGTVVFAGANSTGYGNLVVIAHGSVFSLYGHLTRAGVSCGQSVTAGQQIGTLGSTGNSSGPHLHFELRSATWGAINPFDYQGF